MDRLDMLALAERCEVAPEPYWQLDHDIALALGWEQLPMDWRMQRDWRGPDGRIQREFPRFTKSLDASATLVPKGWEVALYWGVNGFRPQAQLETEDLRLSHPDEPLSGEGNTISLALCAAALRSRANLNDKSGRE